jgi:Lrp/AsnC family leucine-responsive transcriptional regulator
MIDRFDLRLLNLVQRDGSQTADKLAEAIPLSPSAIARRLRRLRSNGAIARTVALLSPRLTERRLRALVFVTLSEHADHSGKAALHDRLIAAPEVQFCYDLAGAVDIALMIDCTDMAHFNSLCDELLTADSTVRRYETQIVKREVKFAPFVDLREAD